MIFSGKKGSEANSDSVKVAIFPERRKSRRALSEESDKADGSDKSDESDGSDGSDRGDGSAERGLEDGKIYYRY